jgi:hypothetical protein
MDILFAIILGISLAAACGFRVFIPMLGISIAALSGHLTLSSELSWLGTWPAVTVFGAATVTEIAAYYIPWLDNILDHAAVPLATACGIILTAAVLTDDISPYFRWALAIIAGGGTAAVVSTATSALRLASTGFTGGLFNFVFSSIENIISIIITLLVILLSSLAGLILIILLFVLVKKLTKRFKSSLAASSAG